jgi:hypothetical protein
MAFAGESLPDHRCGMRVLCCGKRRLRRLRRILPLAPLANGPRPAPKEPSFDLCARFAQVRAHALIVDGDDCRSAARRSHMLGRYIQGRGSACRSSTSRRKSRDPPSLSLRRPRILLLDSSKSDITGSLGPPGSGLLLLHVLLGRSSGFFMAGYTNTAPSQGPRTIRFKGIPRGNPNRELRRCANSANGE